jgi:ACT domain-containing protein
MLLVVFIKRLDTWLMELAVVSVLGADRVGIVAGIASVLARHNANIVDIAQTVVQNIFSMIMVVDISKADVDIAQLRRELEEEGRRLGVMVAVYHIDVFRYMQRI